MTASPRIFALFLALCAVTFLLAALPGTADVVVWNAWVETLSEAGFLAGYNAGDGHLLQPPLGMALLSLSHHLSPSIGLPVFVWPDPGWTGYAVAVWAFLAAGAVLVLRITGSAGWAVAFQLAFALNLAYGYFDLFGIPCFLLALHGLASRRMAWGLFWGLAAALIKWQFLVFAPFVALFLLRDTVFDRERSQPWKTLLQALTPSVLLLVFVLLLTGPGTWLSLKRGMAHDTLSGYALNTGWLLTWAMHLRWPESYGPLEACLIGVIRTQDTRVLALIRLSFGTAFVLALWRQWRLPNTAENLLAAMLAGYLAYFLFNKGAHENHLVPAVAVAGYLAWKEPRWRLAALALALAANLNMFIFYTLAGDDRGAGRVLLGMDLSLPLAGAAVVVLGGIYVKACGMNFNQSEPPA